MWISDTACAATPALLPPAIAGHGTHVAGLLAANGDAGLGVQGTCKNCGISAWKAAYLECQHAAPVSQIQPTFSTNAENRAKAQAVDTGVQALSMSFGAPNNGGIYNCTSNRNSPVCLTLAYSVGRDVAMIASSGNRREELAFPASDTRVISAGGFQQSLAIWDDSPNGSVNCPPVPYGTECGSNYSLAQLTNGSYLTHQELLGSAKQVLSTAYPNMTWVDYAQCGDGYGTPMGDGVGWCTGTSMSAPQIAGVVGVLRSINPLVPTSVPEPTGSTLPGLRTVLAQTASRAGVWDHKLGYGIPDAAAAARKVLGTVAGAVVRNRATPLFRLYNATSKDFADTTSPQYALSLMITQVHKYVQPTSGLGVEPAVPGYTFPYDTQDMSNPNDTYENAPATPRAAVYVLTTAVRPRNEWPALIPLYLMTKLTASGMDHMLVTTTAEIEAAYLGPDGIHCNNGHIDNGPPGSCVGDDYNLRTIQGYIYQACVPNDCLPPGTKKLWREHNAVNNDCAVFVDSEKPTFESAGYSATAHCPGTASNLLGYAYPALNDAGLVDSDGDGLPDAFEYVVGTNPNAADSDGDGMPDGVEFPMAGLQTHDPCAGGTLGARNCGADIIFEYGFELL